MIQELLFTGVPVRGNFFSVTIGNFIHEDSIWLYFRADVI